MDEKAQAYCPGRLGIALPEPLATTRRLASLSRAVHRAVWPTSIGVVDPKPVHLPGPTSYRLVCRLVRVPFLDQHVLREVICVVKITGSSRAPLENCD